MHMADALISPAVGSAALVATAGFTAYAISKIKKEKDDLKVPQMGVMGAFVFAAQMINFAIPGTGSSGHITGAILLAAMLGEGGAFLAMISVLLVQALFFADGGLLALGCNIINMGVIPCFIAYPLVFKPLARDYSKKRIMLASIIATVVGLQLGAFGVVIETTLSGVSQLPFGAFVMLMQPIHLAIGFVEGVITGSILCYVYSENPHMLEKSVSKKTLAVILTFAVFIGGVGSWYASSMPDGLEWSISKAAVAPIHETENSIQEKTSVLPDYNFKGEEGKIGTSVSGIVGGGITIALLLLVGGTIKLIRKKQNV